MPKLNLKYIPIHSGDISYIRLEFECQTPYIHVQNYSKEIGNKGLCRNGFYAIFFIISGEGQFYGRGSCRNLKSGSLLFIPVDQFYQLKIDGEYSGRIVLISTDFIDAVDSLFFMKVKHELFDDFVVINLLKDEACGVCSIINELYIESNTDYHDIVWYECVRSLLVVLFSKCLRLGGTKKTEMKCGLTSFEIYGKYIDLVRTYYNRNYNVCDYVHMLCVTRKTLYAAVMGVTGKTPLEVLHRYMLQEIIHRLLYSDLSIKNISLDMGFAEESYFHRFFKRNMGISATAYRKQFRC